MIFSRATHPWVLSFALAFVFNHVYAIIPSTQSTTVQRLIGQTIKTPTSTKLIAGQNGRSPKRKTLIMLGVTATAAVISVYSSWFCKALLAEQCTIPTFFETSEYNTLVHGAIFFIPSVIQAAIITYAIDETIMQRLHYP